MLSRRVNIAISCGFLLALFILSNGDSASQASDSKANDRSTLQLDGSLSLQQQRARVNDAYGQMRGNAIATGDPGTEVIYGNDDRVEYYDIADPNLKTAADAVCLVVSTGELTDNGNGTYTLAVSPWTASICTDERFYGQLTAGHCTGFLVGENIIATAGHCTDAGNCGSTAFVFGWWKPDSLTNAPTIIPASDVYFCSGILDQIYAGDGDHAVLLVDRNVTGRSPLRIRRSGTVSIGDSLSVIGHGIVLPMKEAGGAVVQNANGAIPWFQANLDTYGGNSGSPVFNTNTYEVEGILVRGATDFVWDGSCFRSNEVPNTGSTGGGLQFEEVSKTTAFESFVPPLVNSAGTVNLTRSVYSCNDSVVVEVRDLDLAGAGSQIVGLTTSNGDTESAALLETPPGSGVFLGTIPLIPAPPAGGSGSLEVGDADTVIATYDDADDGTGAPTTVSDTALTDCFAPVISNVGVQSIAGTQVTITLDTDESATGLVSTGLTCGSVTPNASGITTTSHSILLTGLASLTTYNFSVQAIDLAGNTAVDDNGSLCYTFTTGDQPDYFTEIFETADRDLDGSMLTFTPDGSGDYYSACKTAVSAFPTDPAGGSPIALADDASFEVVLTGGELVSLYGVTYSSVHAGSNGYITFGAGDTDFSESISEHFGFPPRVSALFDDMDPTSGGTISSLQLADRLVITYQDIPEYQTTNQNSFQVELHFGGEITITHMAVAATDGLVGLSAGSGTPGDYVESDLSAYSTCACTDPDGDGVCAEFDNCPAVSNPGQEDADSDEVGDVCDACPALTTPGGSWLRTGDANADSTISSSDIIYVVNYTFKGGPEPQPMSEVGDVNCDSNNTSQDIIYMVTHVFKSGPAPCDVCALP